MFTGIIETMAVLRRTENEGTNRHLYFSSPITQQLRVDQSVAHNGVCLTVVAIDGDEYKVTAIDETLKRTTLGGASPGDKFNIERCMPADGRFDGHIVQGHVDSTAVCRGVTDLNGSFEFRFQYTAAPGLMTVEKGSIAVNGVSLTVVESKDDEFTVHIIPYTLEHTNFHSIRTGSKVNLEFDIIGKYIARLMRK
jgi:riboflavin synthase